MSSAILNSYYLDTSKIDKVIRILFNDYYGGLNIQISADQDVLRTIVDEAKDLLCRMLMNDTEFLQNVIPQLTNHHLEQEDCRLIGLIQDLICDRLDEISMEYLVNLCMLSD